jgi:hypothetical protein
LVALDEEMDNVEKFDGITNQPKIPPTFLPSCGCGIASQESDIIVEKMNSNKPIPRCVKFTQKKGKTWNLNPV